jgi:hypothetical protein
MTILRYAACYAAYVLMLRIDHESRLWFWLLPYAGEYAFNDGGYHGFARNYREIKEAKL